MFSVACTSSCLNHEVLISVMCLRLGKLTICLLVLTLYLNIGANNSSENVMNIAAVLFSELRLLNMGSISKTFMLDLEYRRCL